MDPKTIKTYNKLAKEYDEKTADFWENFPRTFFDKFAELTRGKVLDVGSGPGRDGLLLKEKGLEVICLDASQTMVKACQEKGLEAVEADFAKVPFGDKTFGGVWAYTSLLHVPKVEVIKGVREISRVLKDGGIFGLGMIEGDGEGYRETSGVGEPRWFSFYGRQELEELLKVNGFRVLYFEEFKPRSKNYLNFIAVKV